MKIFIGKTSETVSADFTGMARELLDKFGLLLESTIIIKNSEIVLEDEQLVSTDKIELIAIGSTGK